jgi:hypothetical protein
MLYGELLLSIQLFRLRKIQLSISNLNISQISKIFEFQKFSNFCLPWIETSSYNFCYRLGFLTKKKYFSP